MEKKEPEDEYVQKIKPIGNLDDVFFPYEKWVKEFELEENKKYYKIKDDLDTNYIGIYISDLNPEGYLERLATNKRVEDDFDSKFY